MREPGAIFFAIEQRQHFLKGDQQLYHLQTSQRFDASARHLFSQTPLTCFSQTPLLNLLKRNAYR